MAPVNQAPATTVLNVGGLHYASEKAVVEGVLGDRPGVLGVEANPVAQTATVVLDPRRTSVGELRAWVKERGYHCAGQSAPGHVCDPRADPDHGPHDTAAAHRADATHGHGHGGHAGMSMAAMERDMRTRFLVAVAFTIPIVLWSSVGTSLPGTALPTPFGIDRDVWQLLLSLPVVLYASSIFFTGAWRALRARTLDMMVLVAVAIGAGWSTVRKMRLAWAVGYNALALPVAAGVFAPLGFMLRPEIGAISMSGSSIIVALNAVSLRRLRLPEPDGDDPGRAPRRA